MTLNRHRQAAHNRTPAASSVNSLPLIPAQARSLKVCHERVEAPRYRQQLDDLHVQGIGEAFVRTIIRGERD
jgi:hypothetical protein